MMPNLKWTTENTVINEFFFFHLEILNVTFYSLYGNLETKLIHKLPSFLRLCSCFTYFGICTRTKKMKISIPDYDRKTLNINRRPIMQLFNQLFHFMSSHLSISFSHFSLDSEVTRLKVKRRMYE